MVRIRVREQRSSADWLLRANARLAAVAVLPPTPPTDAPVPLPTSTPVRPTSTPEPTATEHPRRATATPEPELTDDNDEDDAVTN